MTSKFESDHIITLSARDRLSKSYGSFMDLLPANEAMIAPRHIEKTFWCIVKDGKSTSPSRLPRLHFS